jgi:hypothetical protein
MLLAMALAIGWGGAMLRIAIDGGGAEGGPLLRMNIADDRLTLRDCSLDSHETS